MKQLNYKFNSACVGKVTYNCQLHGHIKMSNPELSMRVSNKTGYGQFQGLCMVVKFCFQVLN